jgi:tripartite-type tricarboxylate transporter receptor subunit TctC
MTNMAGGAEAPPAQLKVRESIMKFMWALPAALVTALISTTAFAQGYPTRPVKIISPFPPGTGIDIISRAMADKLTPALGQPVVVENRPGAGGTIGSALTAAATPDGYTVLITSSSITASPFLYKTLSYDTEKDLIPVAPLAVLPNILVIAPNNDKGIKTLADLVSYAKKNPGKLNYASAGVGSATHMSDEKFRVAAGFDAVHIAFKGTPEAMTEIIAGRVDYMFTPIVSAVSLIQNDQLQAIAVGAAKRSALLPGAPTTAEAGLQNADYIFWAGMFVPAKTPKEIVDKLYQEAEKALQSPDLKARLATLGAEPLFATSKEFAAQIKEELAANADLVKKAGIEPN